MKNAKLFVIRLSVTFLLLFTLFSSEAENSNQLTLSVITVNFFVDGNADFEDYEANESITGSGEFNDPYKIVIDITGSGSGNLVSISNTNAYFQIENSHIENGDRGILFDNVTHGKVVSSIINNNRQNGIELVNSFDTEFTNNNVYQNGADNCPHPLSLNQISLASHAGSGWHYDPSGGSIISDNYIHDNYLAGITIEDATNVSITNNIIEHNGKSCATYLQLSVAGENQGQGIDIYNGSDIFVNGNTMKDNKEYGIYLNSLTEDNTITNNNIFDNGQNIQAYDAGTDNTFNCNYWGVEAPSPYPLDPNGATEDQCGQTTLISLTDFTYSTTEGDDNGLSYQLGIIPIVVIALVYRRRTK